MCAGDMLTTYQFLSKVTCTLMLSVIFAQLAEIDINDHKPLDVYLSCV